MKIKEFNTILHASYKEACKIPEVMELLKTSDCVYIYDVKDIRGEHFGGTGLHKVMAVTQHTQINNSTIADAGFDPLCTLIVYVAEVRKSSKMVYFNR